VAGRPAVAAGPEADHDPVVRAFCQFATDPLYGWADTCEERFGTHPVQVVHEWNTAVHVQDNESDPGKRALTKAELHAFFAYCDDEVARARAFGRKGWLPAFRDATLIGIQGPRSRKARSGRSGMSSPGAVPRAAFPVPVSGSP